MRRNFLGNLSPTRGAAMRGESGAGSEVVSTRMEALTSEAGGERLLVRARQPPPRLPFHPDAAMQARLQEVPHLLRRALELREAAREIEPLADDTGPGIDTFGARLRLDAMLDATEAEMRLTWHAYRQARSALARQRLADAIEEGRDAADILRQGAQAFAATPREAAKAPPGGRLETDLEQRLASLRARGHPPRRIVLSPLALRRMRRERPAGAGPQAFDVPISIEFSLEGEEAFVLTYDSMPLEELDAV